MATDCYGEERTFDDGNKDATGEPNDDVPYSCKDRFRKESKNFPRPKECLDYYWKKNTKNIPTFANSHIKKEGQTTASFKDTASWNRGNNYHILHTGYNTYPPNNDTYGKVWGNANLPIADFENKIHYNYSNTVK